MHKLRTKTLALNKQVTKNLKTQDNNRNRHANRIYFINIIFSSIIIINAGCGGNRDLSSRLAKARDAARYNISVSNNVNGCNSVQIGHKGIDEYMKLISDKSLNINEKYVIIESVESNLELLSSHRCEMEQLLVEFYIRPDSLDYNKAGKYAMCVLKQSGAMLGFVEQKMVLVYFTCLYNTKKFNDAFAFIERELARSQRESNMNSNWVEKLTLLRDKAKDKLQNNNTGHTQTSEEASPFP